MTNALTTDFAAAESFARQSLSDASIRAYRADWLDFLGWCQRTGSTPLPASPTTIAAYLASMAGVKSRSTIQRRLVGIGQAHKLSDLDWRPSHPTIKKTLQGLFRQHGRPVRKAAALGKDEVVRLLSVCTGSFVARRDRALFLIGFAGGLRRSELAAIQVEDLAINAQGLRLMIPRSKRDQGGQGAEIGIPRGTNPETCPVAALESWLQASDCVAGPVFRMVRVDGSVIPRALHPASVGTILRRRASEAGLTVGPREGLSAHGLRAGFITQAYRNGARDDDIMEHSRHKDLKTMRGYIRRAKALDNSPARLLGL